MPFGNKCIEGKTSFGNKCIERKTSFGNKCIEGKMRDIVGIFRRPLWFGTRGIVPPCPRHYATGVTPHDKMRSCEFLEPWMLNHFSELTDRSYAGSIMCPECPTKDWRGNFCWLNTRKSGPEVVQSLLGVTTTPTLLGRSCCGASRTTWNCCWLWGISGPRRAAAQWLPWRRSGHENHWNE